MDLSKQALMDAVLKMLTTQASGMMNGKINSIKAVNSAGQAFDFDKVRIELGAIEKPKPQPKEVKTATGFPMRLASVNGERVA